MSSERDYEDALSRFWNSLAAGGGQGTAADLTREDVEVLGRLQSLGTAPVGGPSAEGAWPRVLARIEASAVTKENATARLINAAVVPSVVPNGQVRGASIPSFQTRRWAWGQMATMALCLVTLAVSAIALGWMRQHRSERPAALIAVISTPTAETRVETLFTTMLPAQQVPPAAPTGLVIRNFLVEPGTRESSAPMAPPSATGLQIAHVVKGDLTLTVDGPVHVHRGALGSDAAADEEIAPGREITLHAGDTAVYGTEQSPRFANPGPNSVQVISGGYLAGTIAWLPSDDERFTFVDSTDVYPVKPPLRGTIRATLERISLAPGASTVSPPPGTVVVQVGADKDVSIGQDSDGSLRNINRQEVRIYALMLTPLGADAEAPATQPPSDAASR